VEVASYIEPSYGVPVAVKALKPTAGHTSDTNEAQSTETKQFYAEMKLLQNVKHRNILPLLAVCLGDGPQRCLILPLCTGGDLNARIANADGKLVLSASQRVQTMVAIGRALSHLHTVLKQIHRDVKSANVLLYKDAAEGEDMIPIIKLADFGTVRADVRRRNSGEDTDTGSFATHASTKHIIGTGRELQLATSISY
jgi:serine/threonine protein kinase